MEKGIEMSEIRNKEITIQGFEFKNNRYKITDQDLQSYGFFTTKQDGNDTQVYGQWKMMQLGQGKSVNIGYVEEEFYSEKAKKNIRTKKIISFREPRQESAPVPKGVQDDFGRRLAIHGMVNGLLASGKAPEEINIQSLITLEDRINEALNGKEFDDFAFSGGERDISDIPYEETPF